jgi:arabinofuranan 3-O-arabinosyltransferase
MTAVDLRPAVVGASPPSVGRRRRLGAFAGALLLVAVAFLQRPGQVTFDTKLDLAVDPIGFMSRALHLWNPEATSGELQNQAYGYLFPIGPFFAGGDLLGVPPWITQRAWSALLLCTAYFGVLLLARAMRIGAEPGRLLAALAYGLAPRMLTEIGPLSSEMLPVVMLPWVLLPLVCLDRLGSARRAAALSALAVLCMGGINASAVVMVLVLPGLWLATRRWNLALVRLTAWWCLCVVAATLWWTVPLLTFGQYSLPFLDYIESSATTTAVTSFFQATRGTNQWIGYIVQGEPWWPAGWVLIDNAVLMAATALVAIVGLAGLAMRGLPERRFLIAGMLTGLTLLTIGYVGTVDSPFAATMRDLLDGPLAPLRNVHKFEPVLRLPIALGLAYAASRAFAVRRVRVPAAPVVAALLLAASAPAWLLLLRPGPGWSEIPAHWRQASSWLAAQDATARTLVVPGSGFAQHTWGRTVDEPIQPLAGAPWSTRHQIPLGSEGNIRVMDTVEAVLAQGRGSPGLADFLARSGYRYLLVRHDIDRAATGAPPIAVIRQAVARSPGLGRVATFGPPASAVSGSPVDASAAVPAIEIFEVRRAVPVASATALADVPVVSGGPESTLGLLEKGLIAGPTVLAGDAGSGSLAGASRIVTDGLRRRELNIGRMRDNVSHTLAADEETRQGRVRSDLLPFPGAEHQTVASYQGIRSVAASSGASFADTVGGTEPSYLPFAAIDGDPATSWRSDPYVDAPGQWLEVVLDTPRRVDDVTVDFADDLRVGLPVRLVRIATDQGAVDRELPETPGPHRLSTLPGLTTTVRVTVLALRDDYAGGAVALRELAIPGVSAQHALRAPVDVAVGGSPPVYAFDRGLGERGACFGGGCDQFLARAGEEPHGIDRFFSTPVNAAYDLRLTALPRPGAVPLPVASPVAVSVSSVLTGDVSVGGQGAVDGDPATAWLAEPVDDRPTLSLAWAQARTIDRLRLVAPVSPVAALPRAVLVRTAAGTVPATVGADGWVSFPAVTTDRLAVVVTGSSAAIADPRGAGWPAPVGVAEVEVPGLSFGSASVLDAPCGSGPSVSLDGVSYPTSVSGTVADVRAGRSLPVTVCDDFAVESVQLPAGEHRLRTEPASSAFVVDSAVLTPDGMSAAPVDSRPVTVARWDVTDRSVTVGSGPAALLVVPENFNTGWTATLDGARLRAVRVDGWQQAYEVPAGAGGAVTLTFAPDRPYRDGLVAGAAAVVLVLVLALAPPVRRHRVAAMVPSLAGGWWIVVPLMALVVALGGVTAVVLLLAAMIVRQLRPGALPGIALAAAASATAVAVLGRLQGNGQEWAYGTFVQAAMLAAVCVVAAVATPSASPSAVGPAPDPTPGSSDGPVPDPPLGSASASGGGPSLDPARSVGSAPGPASASAGEPPSGSDRGAVSESTPDPMQGSDAGWSPGGAVPAPHRATLGRSIRLFRDFLHEQTDPDRFYSALAVDSVRQLESYVDLEKAVVLDVGGGPGYFAAEFRAAGATYIGLDPAVGDFAAAGAAVAGMVRGGGTALPVRSEAVDVCYSSNVLEHVATPEAMLDELVRVTRPGGTILVSFTPWLSPWGGHETAPWHYLGGERARRRYVRRMGHEPKNRYRHTLFPVSAARAMRWARAGTVEIVDVLPRYHPWWAHWVARVPLLRETLTWNFTMVLRRPENRGSLPDVTQ